MTVRRLSLTAYLAMTSAWTARPQQLLPKRGTGPLIWVHAEGGETGRMTANFCARLRLHRPEIVFCQSGDMPDLPDALRLPVPPEHPAECARVLASLRPDIVLWNASYLKPALLHAMHKAGACLIGVEPLGRGWYAPMLRWLPDPTPATLALFDHVLCDDPAQKQRLGLDPERLHPGGLLLSAPPPPPDNSSAHEEIAQLLAGRPLWLAAHLDEAEAKTVLSAHRQATRLAHRLLLVVLPADEDAAAGIAGISAKSGLRLCRWDQGEMPDENTQLVLLDGPEEAGLWFRLAPLSFLGGSLSPGATGHDPYPAASLGTAILYGSHVGAHLEAYSRLVHAGAARIVRDASSLAAAVTHLIAPDQAAQMALAGWDVVSSGAQSVDLLMGLIFDALDEKGAT